MSNEHPIAFAVLLFLGVAIFIFTTMLLLKIAATPLQLYPNPMPGIPA
jgi:hypothetical protein